MKNKYKISLPVIAECTKEDLVLAKVKNSRKYVESLFYQTSKTTCNEFYKPLYFRRTND